MTPTSRRYRQLPPGSFRPDPDRAPAAAMVRAAAAQELRVTLRNGEQLLLAIVIPVAALLVLTLGSLLDLPEPRIAAVTPGILALAIISSAFTSQAIVTGFDRRYGVLRRLAATGFPRWLLLAAKSLATTAVIAMQFVLIAAIAVLGFGWRPQGNPLWILTICLLGIATFIGLALLVGGTMRAEAVLGVANLVWLAFVGIGGVILPLDQAPEALRTVGGLTPAGGLTVALRAVLTDGSAPPVSSLIVMLVWLLLGWLGTVRYFRWQ